MKDSEIWKKLSQTGAGLGGKKLCLDTAYAQGWILDQKKDINRKTDKI